MPVENFLFKILTFAIIMLINSGFFEIAQAQNQIAIQNPIRYQNIAELIDAIVGFIFWFAIVLAPLLLLIGAFYLLTSGGNQNRVAKGKKIIFWTAVGIILVLFAKGLLGLIQAALGLK